MSRVDDYLRQIHTCKRESEAGRWYQLAELALEAGIEDRYQVPRCISEVISSRVALADDVSGLPDAIDRTLAWIQDLDLGRVEGELRRAGSSICSDHQERLTRILEYLQGHGTETTAEVASNLRRPFSCYALALEVIDQADESGSRFVETVRAAILTDLGRLPEARDVIEAVLRDHPQDSYAQNQHTRVLRLMGDPQARSSAEENFQRERDFSSAQTLLGFPDLPEELRSQAEEVVAGSRQHCCHWGELDSIEVAFYQMLEQSDDGAIQELANRARHRYINPCQECRSKARGLYRLIKMYLDFGTRPPGY